MAKAYCAVLLLLIITLVNNLIIGQSTTGDCSKDDQDIQKYNSDAFVALTKTIQSEFQNLKAQIQTANNDIKTQVVRLETRIESHDRNVSYSLSDNKRQMQTENIAVKNAIQGQCQNKFSSRCPNSFNFSVAAFPKCYAVLFPAVSWNTAQQRCRQLHKDAHLTVINGALEQQIISKIMINYDCPYTNYDARRVERWGNYFWIGGQLQNVSSCNSAYVWKPNNRTSLPIGYTNWNSGEPNCAPVGLIENCMGIRPDGQWNDLACSWNFCPVCEVTVYN